MTGWRRSERLPVTSLLSECGTTSERKGLKILCSIHRSRYSRSAFEVLSYLKIRADSSVTMHVVNTEQLKVNKSLSSEAIQAIAKALAMAESGGAPC